MDLRLIDLNIIANYLLDSLEVMQDGLDVVALKNMAIWNK